MKSIGSLLSQMADRGIKLWVEDGHLAFRAPQGALTEDLKAQLRARKRELIAFLGEASRDAGTIDKPRAHQSRRNLPLSYDQQRLWVLEQLQEAGAAYNLFYDLNLRGECHVLALESGMNAMLARHEILRTSFPFQDDRPFQKIHNPNFNHLVLLDLSGLSGEAKQLEMKRISARAAVLRFDLAQGPLLRLRLVRLTRNLHQFQLSIHHIISDAWSLSIWVREMASYYIQKLGFRTWAGKGISLPVLPFQYADYAVWQRNRLNGKASEASLEFWKNALRGLPECLVLPLDRPRPSEQTFEGDGLTFGVDRQLTEQIKRLGHQLGATPFMMFYTGFVLLLSHYSGQDDVAIGCPVANRNIPELERLIGFFVNTLVFRTQLDRTQSLASLLGKVREMSMRAYAHQETPFDSVVEALKIPRQVNFNPLIQVSFSFQNAPRKRLELPALMWETPSEGPLLELNHTQVRFDLALAAWEEGGVFGGFWEYNVRLFDRTTILRLNRQFHHILRRMVSQDTRAVSFSFLGRADRHQILIEWNEGGRQSEATNGIHALFENRIRTDRDRVALVTSQGQLSFGTLDRLAEIQARELRGLGVGPDVAVGICMERSLEMFLALLATLKAGGAYVPMNPQDPPARQSLLIRDTGMRVVLSQADLQAQFSELAPTVLSLSGHEMLRKPSLENYPGTRAVDPSNLVYVLFTSGSTGAPKGVAVEHRQLVRYVRGVIHAFDIPEGLHYGLVSSIAADLGNTVLYPALLTGGRLLLPSRQEVLSPDELGHLFRRECLEFLKIVPSHLAALLSCQRPKRVLPAKFLILGGEPCDPGLIKKVRALSPALTMFNHYGPTEATVGATMVSLDGKALPQPIPIGPPLSHMTAYVLRGLNPLPMNVPGELCLGGWGLARGYLAGPHLTAERFIPDPFGGVWGARLYRTGDFVRWSSSGQLVFKGRLDHQVKIRGFRMELGEIEASLGQHQTVSRAVVLAQGEGGRSALWAYVAPECGETISESELKTFLEYRLSPNMIPERIIPLSEFPLTPQGKIDRRALPIPMERVREEPNSPMTNPTEEWLAQIWKELLGQESVGRHDHFFQLGGHSLLAILAISKIQKAIDRDFPVAWFYDNPTIAAIADLLHQNTEETAPNPPLEKAPRDQKLELSFTQQRLWFLTQLEEGGEAYHMPGVLVLEGSLDLEIISRGFQILVDRHEPLRTYFANQEGVPVQIILEPRSFPVPLIDLEGLEPSIGRRIFRYWARVDGALPFSVDTCPPVRCALIRLSLGRHVLLLNLHHMISDALSKAVIIRDLAEVYEALLKGRRVDLPELPIQFADFARWQRQLFRGAERERQLAYWREQLTPPPPDPVLPMDMPPDRVDRSLGAFRTGLLSKSLVQALKSLCRQQEATLFMTLVAAFKVILHRYTQQDDLAIGFPMAGRSHPKTERLVGCFLNTLVLRVRLNADKTFVSLLNQIKKATLGAYMNQNVPFEVLVDELQSERRLYRAPLFDVFVNLIQDAAHTLALPGIQTSPMNFYQPPAKFSLALHAKEIDEEISLRLVYPQGLFSNRRMEVLLTHFRFLLEQIVDRPELPIHEYSLISPETRAPLPDPTTVIPVRPRTLLADALIATARRFPEATAVSGKGATLTYGVWMDRVAQLARHLVAQMRTSGEVIAVRGHRGVGVVTAASAVLVGGGVLLLLDPDLPENRLAILLKSAQVQQMVEVGEPSRIHTESDNIQTLRLDARGSLLPGTFTKRKLPARPQTSPEDPAYIFFTSGTTAEPKGVVGSHQGLAHFLAWQRKTFHIGVKDRVSQLIGLSFDAVLRDFYLPLTSGATLCVPSPDQDIASASVLSWLERERITAVHTVPALAGTWLVQDGMGRDLSCLRWLFCSGEPLTDRLVLTWRKRFPQAGSVINLYGPTETTMVKCWYRTPVEPKPGVQPIGKPLPDTQALILSRNHHRLCGVSEPGEIVLRTPYRGLGYLGSETSPFTPNPFRDDSGDVVYFTGDRGRFLPDGNLEYLGRFDDQIKLHGIRIEPAEIESVLQRHPAVNQAVVICRDIRPGEPHLIAYLQTRAMLDAGTCRDHLAKYFPTAMIPSFFHCVERFPLTPTGKINRDELPTPHFSKLVKRGATPPANPREAMMAGIWAELLGIESVGVEDNFFELGGNSLLATRVLAQVGSAFGMEFPLIRLLFEYPTIRGMLAAMDQWRDRQPIYPLKPAPPSRRHSLSFAQQRLWFLAQLEGGDKAYNMPRALDFKGKVDVRALQKSFREIVKRQEVLRTCFPEKDGVPYLERAGLGPFVLNVVDLQGLTHEDQIGILLETDLREAVLPFDMTRGPLFRMVLIQREPGAFRLLMNMHHIISDAWSLGVIIQEFNAHYTAFLKGKPTPLKPLPIQYADYTFWQQQWLQGERLQQQLNYWKANLAGLPPLLEIPTDRPRPAVQRYRGNQVHFRLPDTLAESLQQLSHVHQTTLFMTLLAVFKVLLWRYSGRTDLAVGTPIANRTRPELENMIGIFLNTLVLRTQLAPGKSFKSYLAEVREKSLGSYSHRDIPFEYLVELIQPERSLSYSPIFQIVFMFQEEDPRDYGLPGLSVRKHQREKVAAKFDFILSLSKMGGRMRGIWEFNTDLFNATTFQRMTYHYQTLLQAIVENQDNPVAALDMITAEESRQVLAEWNDTRKINRGGWKIHDLFESQAKRIPHAIAIEIGNRMMTYYELARRSHQLAHVLRAKGVRVGERVGVCFPRSMEMLIGVLAVLKVGAVYVPIDPRYPADRARYILKDIGARCFLTHGQIAEKFTTVPAEVILLDRWNGHSGPAKDLKLRVTPDHLAYIIFTSGSTGRPKGVMVQHGPAVNLIQWVNRSFSVGRKERLLFVTSLCFDLSVYDIFGILGAGGVVFMPEETQFDEPQALALLLNERVITFWDSAPAALQQLTLPPRQKGSPHLRLVFLSGDWIPLTLPGELAAAFPYVRVIGLGGATEATVWSNFFPVKTVEPHWKSIPYGRPIWNASYFILDSRLQPQPIGLAGDLYIGGPCLSLGYYNQPVQTAIQYLPNPFDACPGGHLYATGDRARWMSQGMMEFLGRLDSQVKIRGFRIELEEIQHVLLERQAVRKAVVMVREDRPGDRQLAAYVVLKGRSADIRVLLKQLKVRLPDYMVPSHIIVLDAFPTTSNGKLDRKALPVPDVSEQIEADYAAPQSPEETLLAAIFAEVLELEKVGLDDDFFEIGGNSLLGVQVVARVRDSFHVSLPLRILFETPSVKKLARYVRNILKEGRSPLTLQTVSRQKPLPLSFSQQRMWFLHRIQEDLSAYNMTMATRLQGGLDVRTLERCFLALGERHEVLRATFKEEAGVPHTHILDRLNLAMPLLDISGISSNDRGRNLARIMKAHAGMLFTLETGPLLKVSLIQTGAGSHVLLTNMHHMVSDGLSLWVAIREITRIYGAFIAGKPDPLAPLTVQYGDFAFWQRQWLRGEALATQVNYWKDQLANLSPMPDLPSDAPRPSLRSYRGSSQNLEVSRETLQALRKLSRSHQATLFMTLLATFKLLLFRYTRQPDLVVGSPISGRTHLETEALIGSFFNVLALRTELAGEMSFSDYLRQVRRVSLAAYAHQDLPFERIVEELQPDRILSRHPIFEILFNNVPTHSRSYQLPGLTLTPIGREETEAKFIMTLYFREHPDQLQFTLVYPNGLFHNQRMAHFLDQYHFLLTQVTENPGASLGECSLVTPAMRAFLPDPRAELPPIFPTLLPSRILQNCLGVPDRTALCQGGRHLDYRCFLARVDGLVEAMAAVKVPPGAVVGVTGHRSLEFVIGMVAVVMSGRVFMPLEPGLPSARQRTLLREAKARAILTAGAPALAESLMDSVEHVIPVDSRTRGACGAPLEETRLPSWLPYLDGDDPAYIFFTSGTTGLPKTIVSSHAGMAHFVDWQRRRFEVGPKDRVAQLSGPMFEVLIREIFLPLSSGGTLCLPDRNLDLGPDHVLPWLDAGRITLLHTVPTLAKSWLSRESTAALSCLRFVFFAGEPLTVSLVTSWWEAFPGSKVINLYGPTETTLAKCSYEVPHPPLPGVQPLGRPLPGVQLWVLNQQVKLCGVGEPGEIVIRTPFRNLGYVNHGAGGFRPNPFRRDPKDGVYFTGDRGRYRPDGTLEILGRVDDQIKLRGIRIEPQEIEAAIRQHPSVRDTVVMGRTFEDGEKRLVAYVVPRSRAKVTASQLRSYLASLLPASFIPASMVLLPQFPHKTTGKLDRDALPLPELEDLSQAYVPPRNAFETTLTEIWAEEMNLAKVGIHDHFFELGGHSLLALRVISRIRQHFGIELPLKFIFEKPTPAELGELVAILADDAGAGPPADYHEEEREQCLI